MKNLLLLGLVAVLGSCGKPAKSETSPGSGAGATLGACRYPIDNGCAAANKNGSFHNPSLLTSAQQSGQNSLLPRHPMTFNIPGVDYPIGPDKTLTPKDPRTITWSATTPCAYIGTGPNAPPHDFVGCFKAGTYPNAVLDNYDFSGAKIGKSPLVLYLNSDALAGSKIMLTNDYFYIPASPSGNKAIGFNGPSAGNWSITAKNIQCDGSIATSISGFCFVDDAGENSATTLDIEYSAFTKQGVGRVSSSLRNGSFIFKYNFVQGLNDLMTTNHGEVDIRTCSHRNCTVPLSHQEGNFIIWNRTSPGSVNNATFFLSDGASDGIRFTTSKIINNISVNNTASGGSLQVGNGLFNFRAASMGDATITGNWLDAAGQGNCGLSGPSGGNNVTASTSGNTINVTAAPGYGNFPIEPGWMIFHSGFATATITAYGSGSGYLGTYTFDGPPQALGSDSAWSIVPGFKSQTLSGNYLLNDPRHTGVPTAIGFTGPQFAPTNCF